MVEFCIHKKIFGTPFHLYFSNNGKMTKVENLPEDVIIVGEQEAQTLAKLYDFRIPFFPPTKYMQSFREIFRKNKEQHIPWEYVLPKKVYVKEVKKFITTSKDNFSNLDLTYYNKYYKPTESLFESLQPAKVDTNILFNILRTNPIDGTHLKTFVPQKNSFAKKPEYSRIDTLTGRLKTVSGPNILLLKKEHRNVLVSRFGKKGRIHYLDYTSLEPRTLLSIKGMEDIPEDIYQHVVNEAEINVSRDIIKRATISRLYGAGDNAIAKQLKDSTANPKEVIAIVDDYFGIDELRQELVEEFYKNDGAHIKNHYGRIIQCENAAQHALLNYYIQSTAVDVALQGFNQIIKRLVHAGIQDLIVPIFILHDAILFDIHNDVEYLIPKLCKVGSMDIPKFENTFFCLKQENV